MNQLQWWELQVLSDPALDESLSWQLQALGCQGTASQVKDGQLRISGYLYAEQYGEADLEQMASELRLCAAQMEHSAEVSWRLIQEEDWANNWKEYWHPTPVGNRLLIHPDWLPVPKTDRIVIRLNPGVAFGTGAHATTQLCLAGLEHQLASIQHPFTLADIGCGTGILAIAGLKLGADRAYAVDVDPLAVKAAQECRDLNLISPDQMSVFDGSISEVIEEAAASVNGACCNILAEPIISLIIPHLNRLIAPGGWVLLSGILHQQIPMIAEALAKSGWEIRQTWQQEDWVCLATERLKTM